MIESYIAHLCNYSMEDLELFSWDWLTAPDIHQYKRRALIGIINEKLRRYEQEY